MQAEDVKVKRSVEEFSPGKYRGKDPAHEGQGVKIEVHDHHQPSTKKKDRDRGKKGKLIRKGRRVAIPQRIKSERWSGGRTPKGLEKKAAPPQQNNRGRGSRQGTTQKKKS